MAPSESLLTLPADFVLVELPVGDDRHAAGQLAARRALAELGVSAELIYDGSRPLVADGSACVSITHGRSRALAVAARVQRLGIDLCDDDPRLPALAMRYFATEHHFAQTPRALATCLAATEAGLKALGLGLLDGEMFDHCVVRVASLQPPRLVCGLAALELLVGDVPDGAIAIAFTR